MITAGRQAGRQNLALSFLALTLASVGASVAQGAAPGASQAPRRVWLYDGRNETYFRFAFLTSPGEPVLAIDPDDEASWNVVLPSVEHEELRQGAVTDIVMVGRTSARLAERLYGLQASGRARVSIEPDPWRLAERELATRDGEVTPIWVGSRGLLGIATHAASVRTSSAETFVPVAEADELARLLEAGRAHRAISVGADLPDAGSARRPADVLRLGGFWDVVGWSIGTKGGGDFASGFTPSSPPQGSKFTLAFYTGKDNPDPATPCAGSPPPDMCIPHLACPHNPLAFYDSTVPAVQLCQGRNTCIPVGLIPDLGIQPCFNDPPMQYPSWCQWPGNGATVEDYVKAGIRFKVLEFNTDPGNWANGYKMTRLAVVGHFMDIPYRQFMFPYTPCDDATGPLKNLVDTAKTDSTYPRDRNCTDFVDSFGHWDGGTGSADFFLADIDDDERADLDFGRVAAQTLYGATLYVETLQSLLTPQICFPTPCPPPPTGSFTVNGEGGTGFYTLHSSLFDDAYGRANPQTCKPPQIPGVPPLPYCPHDGFFACEPGTYDQDEHFRRRMDAPPTGGNFELGFALGHQINGPDLPPGVHYCDEPGKPAPGCPTCASLDAQFVDRQRTMFVKGSGLTCAGHPSCNASLTTTKEPDGTASIFSSNRIQELQRKGTPPALAPAFWTFGGSATGNYNYVNDWTNVRFCTLGPDSSWLSTLMPSGAASYQGHMGINPKAVDGAGREVCQGAARPDLFLRDLALGRRLGAAVRRAANFGFDQCDPDAPIARAFMLVGEPNLRLHVTGNLGPNNLRIVTAPGPGVGPLNGPSVAGFNQDGIVLGGPAFKAYGYKNYGCNVATGQIDGYATDEIITGAGYSPAYSSQVRAFNWDGTPINRINFLAFGTAGYGVNVASFDYDGDGVDEIVAAAGPGSTFGPQVRAWRAASGAPAAIAKVDFVAFSPGGYGANAAGGNIDGTDGEELCVGRGPGGSLGPEAAVWRTNATTGAWEQWDVGFVGSLPPSYGVHVGSANVDGDLGDMDDMVFGAGPGPMNGTGIAVLQGKPYTARPLGNPSPLGGKFAVFGPTDQWGVRVATSQLDLDPADYEVLCARGWDPTDVSVTPGFVNSLVRGFDYDPSVGNSTHLKPILEFAVNFQEAADSIGGLSIAGGDLGKIGIPAGPLDAPNLILDPIVVIIGSCGASTFTKGGASQEDLLSHGQIVHDFLTGGDLEGALEAVSTLRSHCIEEVADAFVRDALTAQADALADAIGTQMADQPPVASIEGPDHVCPWVNATWSAASSTDPDERGLSRSDIQSYAWLLDGQSVGDDVTLTTAIPDGAHTLKLIVTDTFGLEGTAFLTVDAEDTRPPTGEVWALPVSLWPPNHKLATIQVNPQLRDDCDPAPTFSLVSVTSSEPESGCGSEDEAPDVLGVEPGTPSTSFLVRAERCGAGPGRTYTVKYEVKDRSGNASLITGSVTVPHDQGK